MASALGHTSGCPGIRYSDRTGRPVSAARPSRPVASHFATVGRQPEAHIPPACLCVLDHLGDVEHRRRGRGEQIQGPRHAASDHRRPPPTRLATAPSGGKDACGTCPRSRARNREAGFRPRPRSERRFVLSGNLRPSGGDCEAPGTLPSLQEAPVAHPNVCPRGRWRARGRFRRRRCGAAGAAPGAAGRARGCGPARRRVRVGGAPRNALPSGRAHGRVFPRAGRVEGRARLCRSRRRCGRRGRCAPGPAGAPPWRAGPMGGGWPAGDACRAGVRVSRGAHGCFLSDVGCPWRAVRSPARPGLTLRAQALNQWERSHYGERGSEGSRCLKSRRKSTKKIDGPSVP